MKNKSLSDLNKLRKKDYYKDEKQENFLLETNKALQQKEQKEYINDLIEEYPFIFIYGVPRSGTTILAQVIANSFDIGYINNFMARFWLAPVTGIKLSQLIYGDSKNIKFESHYATTSDINDIHEFGYFWRYWLKKDQIEDYLDIEKTEQKINWEDLKKTLLNMQFAFQKGLCMKNIFGAFHIKKISNILKNALFVYVERDPLDNAISILEARKKFYEDLNTWWSIIPLEYNLLKDKPYMEQITGQVYFLQKFYNTQIDKGQKNIIKVPYHNLCHNPNQVLKEIQTFCIQEFNYALKITSIPEPFKFKTYDNSALKNEFVNHFKNLEK